VGGNAIADVYSWRLQLMGAAPVIRPAALPPCRPAASAALLTADSPLCARTTPCAPLLQREAAQHADDDAIGQRRKVEGYDLGGLRAGLPARRHALSDRP